METFAIDKESKKIILSIDFNEVPAFSSSLSSSAYHYFRMFSGSTDPTDVEVYRSIYDKHSELSDAFISLFLSINEQK